MKVRIGVDTGGTHTDLVLVDERGERLITLKVPTTPDELSDGIVEGMRRILRQAGATPGDIDHFVYGTTLVTNLIVEEKTQPVGLLATEGFRDVLEIGRASRKPNIYDIHWRPPAPLVPRHLRLAVRERIDAAGKVVTPLDEASVRQALAALVAARVSGIAVCLLNAHANPAHERRIAEIAAEVCPGIDLSLSSEVVREFREYERTSTTVLNAYVQGRLVHHLDNLSGALKAAGMVAAPYLMRSNGGVMTFESAKRLPVAITHSGPMGGIVGGAAIAAACGLGDVITLDMGGTSADVSLIAGGRPTLTTRGKLAERPVLLPMLDLITIGAGGGSIAWLDDGGGLRVGPTSAGAVPGPACYGRGGREPTVTDANLACGRLNPDYFLAGERALDGGLARAAIDGRIARPTGLSTAAAALGILAIAESHMVNAIKLISVQRGLDPRDFTLVAFGGAGPLHAVRLAEAIGIRRVLIPPAPGNVSAFGLLTADIRHDFVRTQVATLDSLDPRWLAAAFAELVDQGKKALAAEAVSTDRHQFVPAIDLRYQGQNYELSLPLAAGFVAAPSLGEIAERFHAEHRRVYGYDLPSRTIQLVNLRLAAIAEMPRARWPQRPAAPSPARPAVRRKVVVAADRAETVAVFRFDDLPPDNPIAGPAVIEYAGSTLFVPPEWTARIDPRGNATVEADGGDSARDQERMKRPEMA